MTETPTSDADGVDEFADDALNDPALNDPADFPEGTIRQFDPEVDELPKPREEPCS